MLLSFLTQSIGIARNLIFVFFFMFLFAAFADDAHAQVRGGGGRGGKKIEAKKDSVATDSLKKSAADSLKRSGVDSLANDSTKREVKAKDSTKKQPAEMKSVGAEDIKKTADSISYSANTVGFIYRNDLMRGFYAERNPDTTLTFRHRYGFVNRYENLYQDLGNTGTAMQHIFDKQAPDIGNRWGNTVFEPYIRRANRMRYFNTMSPFTEIDAVIGGQGRSLLNIEFARNINPEWSFSVLYHTIVANYVVHKTFRKNDNQIRHQTAGLATRYFSPSRRYKLLAHYLFYNHKADETGGLRTLRGVKTGEDLFRVQPAEITMRFERETVSNLQYGHNFHTLQQLNISKDGLIALFHTLDYTSETRRYLDRAYERNKRVFYYDSVFFDTLRTQSSYYENTFSRFANRAGIRGSKMGFAYSVYADFRTYAYAADFVQPDTSITRKESFKLNDDAFLGGSLRYDYKDNIYGSLLYEKLLGKDYQMLAEIVHPRINLRHKRMNYAPDAVQRRFFGNHFRWNNDFENTTYTHTSASSTFVLSKGKLSLTPVLSYSTFKNYIYYDSLRMRPKQSADNVNLLQAGLHLEYKKEALLFKLQTYYTQRTGADVIRVPKLFANATLIYDKKAFNNALHYQVGADLHFRSKYLADDYNPFLAQFFLQNKELVGGYPVLDVFFNFKVKRFIAFLKINNLAQDMLAPGYFVTPYYMGQPRSAEVGINWMFYD
jgi:hypothetical protein